MCVVGEPTAHKMAGSSRTGTGLRALWRDVDRDWKSVAVGAAIVAVIFLFEIHVPW